MYSDQHLHEAGVGRRAADGVPPQSCVYDETANGVILVAQLQHPASTDAVELTTDSHVLVRYPSLDAWRVGAAGDIFPCGKAVRQIAALEAGFVILFEDGTVATMGEARFEACLGREVSEERCVALQTSWPWLRQTLRKTAADRGQPSRQAGHRAGPVWSRRPYQTRCSR